MSDGAGLARVCTDFRVGCVARKFDARCFGQPLALVLSLALLLTAPTTGSGYQLLEGPQFSWRAGYRPVPYWVTNRANQWFTVDRAVTETRAAFATWSEPPQIGIEFSYRGLTNQRPFDFFDDTNTVGFSTEEHMLEIGISRTTLAVTSWLVLAQSRGIVESDILVNPLFYWSDTPPLGAWDYRSMLVHEIGHFMGLGHSNVGRVHDNQLAPGSSVMWPFSFGAGVTTGRVLTADDIAGASVLYPGPAAAYGRIRGTIAYPGGERVGHAHVVAYEPTRDFLVGAWADASGDYVIHGLPAGRYVIRVNPLPDEHSPANYFFDRWDVDSDFLVTVHPRLVNLGEDGTVTANVEVRQ